MTREEQILHLVKETTRLSRAVHKYESQPRDYGTGDLLYMREAHLIDQVGPEGTDMGTLARRLGVSGGAVSQTAARLEKKGYIYRQAKEEDSRCICCFLTERGLEVYKAHQAIDRKKYPLFYQALADFSPQDLTLCRELLERILQVYQIEV